MKFGRNALAVLGLALVITSSAWAVACGGGGAKQSDVDALKEQVSGIDALKQQLSGVTNADAVKKIVFDAMDKPVGTGGNADGNAALWKIQPGFGTVMIEYNTRMANAWYAAQAQNWEMVKYQVGEMIEIQEVGETTRPARGGDVKKFEDQQLKPLMDAATKKDLTTFNDQYAKTLHGCNACHKNSKSADFPSFGFVNIVPPPEAATKNIDWKGQ